MPPRAGGTSSTCVWTPPANAAALLVAVAIAAVALFPWFTNPSPPALLSDRLTASSTPAAPLTVTAVNASRPLRGDVLLFGDSITAGGYYVERGGRLQYAARPYARSFEAYLRSGEVRNPRSTGHHPDGATRSSLRADTANNVTEPLRAVVRGYPGRTSAELLVKIKAVAASTDSTYRRNAPFIAAIVLAGTNDALGQRIPVVTAVKQIVAIHQHLRRQGIPTLAVLLPQVNFNTTPSDYANTVERGYCGSKRLLGADIAARRDQINRALREGFARRSNSSSLGSSSCVLDLELLDHRLQHPTGPAAADFWSDCLHPNPAGYRVMGAAIARAFAARWPQLLRECIGGVE